MAKRVTWGGIQCICIQTKAVFNSCPPPQREMRLPRQMWHEPKKLNKLRDANRERIALKWKVDIFAGDTRKRKMTNCSQHIEVSFFMLKCYWSGNTSFLFRFGDYKNRACTFIIRPLVINWKTVIAFQDRGSKTVLARYLLLQRQKHTFHSGDRLITFGIF